jgi:hypothetical protein
MLHWKKQGAIVRQGISFYHPKDEHSIGFVIRIWNYGWQVRYSKHAKCWFINLIKIDPKAYERWLNKL